MNLFLEEESLNLLTEVNKSVKSLYTRYIIKESKCKATTMLIVIDHWLNDISTIWICEEWKYFLQIWIHMTKGTWDSI